MRTTIKVFIALLVALSASDAHAFATIQIRNNTGKTVLEAGDMVQVLVQHSLDEQFSEIYFGTATKTIYTGGWNDPPFITKMNSSDGQKYDVLIEFTVPYDFSSTDSSFLFSARLYKNGGSYTQVGHERIAVRGIPKALAPQEGAGISGLVDFKWNPVFGSSRYQLEVVRFVVDNDPKKPQSRAGEIALDTLLTTNSFTFSPTKTGDYSWIVRAEAEGVWGGWSSGATFEVTGTASVNNEDLRTQIRLYPQPAADVIYVESRSHSVRQMGIYGLDGKQLLWMGNITGQAITQFSTSSLLPGLYHTKLILDDGEVILPFIKH